jgi:hypothetical protein
MAVGVLCTVLWFGLRMGVAEDGVFSALSLLSLIGGVAGAIAGVLVAGYCSRVAHGEASGSRA